MGIKPKIDRRRYTPPLRVKPSTSGSSTRSISSKDLQTDRSQVAPGEPQKPHGAFRILCFFAILGILAFCLDTAITAGLRQIPTSWFGVLNRITTGKVNTEILITGSSRTLVHYDPRVIQDATGMSAYNLGLNGSQTDMQLALLKSYLQHNRPPRLLIHNLDPHSLQITHGGVFDPGQYIPYLREPALYQALRKIDPQIWKSRYFPLYGYVVEDLRFTWVQGIKSLVRWFPREDRVAGFTPRSTPWTGDFEALRAAHPEGITFEVEPAGIQALQELIETCRSHGVPLLFVYSPEYWQMQQIERNRSAIFTCFRELADRFQVPIWDFSDSPLSKQRDLFYNSQHLNATGAALFSADLAARLARESVALKAPPPVAGN